MIVGLPIHYACMLIYIYIRLVCLVSSTTQRGETANCHATKSTPMYMHARRLGKCAQSDGNGNTSSCTEHTAKNIA